MRRALLVEDNTAVRTVLRMTLAELGYAVVAAEDGHQGVARLAEGPYELVLTDLRLPGPSGLYIAEMALTLVPKPAVLIVSGYLTEESEKQATALGVTALRKPFTVTELSAAIQLAVGLGLR